MDKTKIITFTIKGKPLTQKEFIQEVIEATEDVKKGNFLTTEEIRAKFRNKK